MDILLVEALKVACRAHASQLDKSGEPYILHPLRVAFDYGLYALNEQVVALLHDVIEDTPVTYAEIYAQFGPVIADAVASVSRGYVNSDRGDMVYKPTEGYDKELYIDFVLRARNNVIGRRVKIADLKDNLSPVRMNHLPPDQRGITKRYERAMKLLTME
jgi:(p)ppGpp synthase/HD superfamily hydrolase